MKWSCAMPTLLLLLSVCHADETLFDSNPQHPWNRLHVLLHTRQTSDGEVYRTEALEPLLVRRSAFLIQGESHQQAIRQLDEFLQHRADQLIVDPLKRAILQRDLWAIFVTISDPKVTHQAERRALQKRLTQIIRRIALTADEIQALPHNLADAVKSEKFPANWNSAVPPRPFLPGDLLQPDGPWVVVRNRLGHDRLAVPLHVQAMMGRSAFLLLLRLPEGRQATLDYLKTIRKLPSNSDIPQIPTGTQVALLRRMMLIDETGTLRITPVTESLQMRGYRELRQPDMYEFSLRRKDFFAGLTGGLHPTAPDEINYFDLGYVGFASFHHPDPLTRQYRPTRTPVVMKTCIVCHAGPGIFGFQSMFAGHFPRPPLAAGDPDDQITATIDKATATYTWGLLHGLWGQNSD